MPPLMAAEVVGESSEDDETLAYVGRLQPPVLHEKPAFAEVKRNFC